MADLVTWQASLVADMASVFPDTDLLQGERSGKATDRPKITTFWAGDQEAETVVVGQARLIVRYWPATAKIRDDASGGVRDPTELETAKLALQDFLQTKQKAYPSTGVWFSRLVRVTPDYDPDEWGVEGELLLVFTNPAVI